MSAEIRLVADDELLTVVAPIRVYAFRPTPGPIDPAGITAWAEAEHRTHVLLDGGEPSAVATTLPMTQNVRGAVVPMGGVAGVATHPAARRRGHARRLMVHLLADMRDQGQVVSTLYPFRASFYERLGWASLPKPVVARFAPGGLAGLPTVDGTVEVHPLLDVLDEYRAFLARRQSRVHGFGLRDRGGTRGYFTLSERWAALARGPDGSVAGVMNYAVSGFNGVLEAGAFLYDDLTGRTLLLGWLARHLDQVAGVSLKLHPDASPALWLTDLDVTVESRVALPEANPPMGRVLSVEGLAGCQVGTGAVTVRLVDELLPEAAGTFGLAAEDGLLTVRRGGSPAATLTPPGLAALVYGVLDPAELALRGWTDADGDTLAALRALFPPVTPYLYEEF